MSRRVQRLNQLIKQEISQIILREVDFSKDVLVTVTRVDTSPNLIQSKIYISAIPEENISDVLKTLRRSIYNSQQKLNKRLKMRPIPKIIFMEEKETREAARIEELLEEIKNKNNN